MKRTTEELTKARAELLGERMTEDAAISLAEDITDSVSADERDYDDLQRRYDELDKTWRERYTKRFYDKGDDKSEEKTVTVEEKDDEDLTVDDLFEEKERK